MSSGLLEAKNNIIYYLMPQIICGIIIVERDCGSLSEVAHYRYRNRKLINRRPDYR
jgi:hypothetical protein